MKRPPVLIIINLILLTGGYLYCAYYIFAEMLDHMRGGTGEIGALWPLSFLTFWMIVIYIEILKRNARIILLLGVVSILLSGCAFSELAAITATSLFFITGIQFIIWSIILLDARNHSEDICSKCATKYKYWLYSSICFGAGGVFFGGLGYSFWGRLLKRYEAISLNMYKTMGTLLLLSVLQFIIYFVLCKIIEQRESKINSPEKN